MHELTAGTARYHLTGMSRFRVGAPTEAYGQIMVGLLPSQPVSTNGGEWLTRMVR